MKRIIASLLISSALFAVPISSQASSMVSASNATPCEQNQSKCTRKTSDSEYAILKWIGIIGSTLSFGVIGLFFVISFLNPTTDEDIQSFLDSNGEGGGFGAGGGDAGGAGCGGDGGGGCY